MTNAHRGEIEARLDGQSYTLCLTLSSLAELEHAFGVEDMIALAGRFESGKISANDCVRIVGAGLRGGGNDIPNERVAQMKSDIGAAGFIDIVARLLSATFASPTEQQRRVDVANKDGAEEREVAPFPGARC